MTASPSAAVRAALESRRESLNARFRVARLGAPHLAADEVLAHLGGPVTAVLERVARHDPGACSPVLDELFDASVELFARRLLGGAGPGPVLGQLFARVLPAAASLLAREPGRLVAPLCNAALALGRERPGLADTWLGGMAAAAPVCASAAEWLDAGRVLAWRAGLAQHRGAALEALARSSSAVLSALSVEGPVTLAALAAARADPWVSPFSGGRAEPLALARRAGGHRALGGTLAGLPVVVRQGHGLYVLAGDETFALHADCFGATLVRAARADDRPEDGPLDAPRVGKDGELRDGARGRKVAWVAAAASVAADATTLALTLPHSYLVYVFPREPRA